MDLLRKPKRADGKCNTCEPRWHIVCMCGVEGIRATMEADEGKVVTCGEWQSEGVGVPALTNFLRPKL